MAFFDEMIKTVKTCLLFSLSVVEESTGRS